eukprot:sb/3473903/
MHVYRNRPTSDTSKHPIRTRYLDHVTVYRPIRDLYFLIRSVPACMEGTPTTTREKKIARQTFVKDMVKLELSKKKHFLHSYANRMSAGRRLLCTPIVGDAASCRLCTAIFSEVKVPGQTPPPRILSSSLRVGSVRRFPLRIVLTG